VTAVKEAAMKRKKKSLETIPRCSESGETRQGQAETAWPAPVIDQEFLDPATFAEAVANRSVAILPRAFEWTVVPGPVEIQ
jgi:hypothetical protein